MINQPVTQRRSSGHKVALTASITLLASASLLLGSAIISFYLQSVHFQTSTIIATKTIVPALIALAYLTGTGGIAAAVVAVSVYHYRARWFWRSLVIAGFLLLFQVPVGTAVGLIALALLMRFNNRFHKP